MPKSTRSGDAIESELPSTLQRSDEKARRTFAQTYDSAIEQYDGDEQRARQTAFAICTNWPSGWTSRAGRR